MYARTDNGRTAVELAFTGNPCALKVFLDHDANIEPSSYEDAVFIAVEYNYVGLPKILVASMWGYYDNLFLYWEMLGKAFVNAMEFGSVDCVRLLFTRGAKSDREKIRSGMSTAIRDGHIAVVRFLVNSDISPNARFHPFEDSLADEAVKFHRPEILRFLLDSGNNLPIKSLNNGSNCRVCKREEYNRRAPKDVKKAHSMILRIIGNVSTTHNQ